MDILNSDHSQIGFVRVHIHTFLYLDIPRHILFMSRRKDSDDECEIDDALQQTFYYEPKVSGKKRKRPIYERVKLPKPVIPKRGPSLPMVHDPGLPGSSLDNTIFHNIEDELADVSERLPVKGKVRRTVLHFVFDSI